MNISKEKNMNIEELEAVVGGVSTKNSDSEQNSNAQTKESFCPKCNKDTTFLLYMGGRGICKDCGFEKLM